MVMQVIIKFLWLKKTTKTSFRCPGAIGLFEWVVMTFGLKNAGATYQRAINYIFYKLIGKIVEIYIDDMVVNPKGTKNICHTYFYTGIGERNIIDLTTIKQRANESGAVFLQRFRETRNLCFSLNLTDDQLATLAVQGMLPT